jgi:hypothetical protein
LKKSISDKKFSIFFYDEGYYELVIKENVEIFVEDAISIKKAQEKISGTKSPLLIYVGKHATTNIETLKYLSKSTNMPYSSASGYIMTTLAQKILGNFYLKINKPERPTKIFNNKEEALNWIREYI